MFTRRNIAGLAAAVAIAGGGLVTLAPSASATPSNCLSWLVTGSEGHRGGEVRCTGGTSSDSYRAWVWCKKADGYEYYHLGPWVFTGGTSTVWCDIGARVKDNNVYIEVR